jgi:Undecaprenyl-phosphate glucose phosphotransferase
MPSMAEPNIAIDIVPAASSMSEAKPPFTPRPRLAIRTIRLILLDAGITAIAAFACFALFQPSARLAIIAVVSLTVSVILSFFERGLYAPADVVSREFAWRRTTAGWFQGVAIGTSIAVCTATISGPPGSGPGAVVLFGLWLPTFLLVGYAALAGGRLLHLRFHAGPAPLNRTVIIGERAQVHDLLSKIRTSSRRGFDVIGIVEHGAPETGHRTIPGPPVVGDIAVLEQMIRQDAVDTVLVAMPWSAGDAMRTIVNRIAMAPVDVYIYPGMNGLNLPLRHADKAFDLPLLMACTRPIGGWGAAIKRTEDVVFSLGLLLFISPVMLTIAAAIKLTSAGPVLFRQRRLGYNNRVIEVLKFRSMYTHLSDADDTVQSARGDKRVTPVGAWLRKFSLDELPQLLNVLKGDMSLVGPRPHALATTAAGLALEDAVPVYSSRHRVKPGITGWAQVNGFRGALDTVDKIVHRVNHDLYYIENWSPGFDLEILWRTAKLVFADDNAF